MHRNGSAMTSIKDVIGPTLRASTADFADDLTRATERGILAYFARFRTLMWKLRLLSRRGVIRVLLTKSQFDDPFSTRQFFPVIG